MVIRYTILITERHRIQERHDRKSEDDVLYVLNCSKQYLLGGK